VSKFSASRSALLGAVLAVLAFGLFTASALSWSGGEENEQGSEETTTVETGPTGPAGSTGETGQQGTQTQPAEQQTPPADEQAVHAFTPPATPQEVPVPTPAIPTAPNIEILGETGTRGERTSGSPSGGPVVAQAPGTTVLAAESTTPTRELAKTGFNAMTTILLGALSLAGSTLLFWRARTI
jgi:LPXTG-motif cell wall-anchored protein